MLPQREIQGLVPNPDKRFGHTITMVSRDRAVLFGGAIGENNYKITNDILAFDCKAGKWSAMYPKNVEEGPSPRAAHAATSVQMNQMVIFGGSHSNGNLADNSLYLLKMCSSDLNGRWVHVPVEGALPAARYGHTMVFFRPYIIVFGGNIANEPNNEVWTLSIEHAPFTWARLDIKEGPSPRAYHAAAVWRSKPKGDMVLVFGGRNMSGEAMKDMWGLRRHNSGEWDWLKAPYSAEGDTPSERYQHSLICTRSLALVVGGRNTKDTSLLPLDVYNLDSSLWTSFPGVNRFRHVSWLSGSRLHIYGGFESMKPSVCSGILSIVDLFEAFAAYPELVKGIDMGEDQAAGNQRLPTTPGPRDENPPNARQLYTINNRITVAEINGDEGLFNTIDINQLQQEGVKMVENPVEPVDEQEEYARQIANTIIKTFLRSLDFRPTENAPFALKPEMILVLCDLVIKVLKASPSLIYLRPGVKIFGSLHGQMGDLLRFFKQYGVPDDDFQFERKSDIEGLDYLFLGNYVDRGTNSLDVICLLLALKLKFPAHIHLLRGSHEDRKINQAEGLLAECQMRLKEDALGPQSVYNKLNEVFEYLSFAAVIGNKVFCVHAGIGLNLRRLEQIERLRKPFAIQHGDVNSADQKIVFDMLWSDPVLDNSETQNRVNEHREHLAQGTIVRFGTDRIAQFLAENNLQIIVRSHEPVIDGADEFGNSSLYTIFSCTDYCGITGNDAAIFLHHRHAKQLITHTLKNVKGATKWYNLAQMRRAVSSAKRDEGEAKERPVTPVRRVARST